MFFSHEYPTSSGKVGKTENIIAGILMIMGFVALLCVFIMVIVMIVILLFMPTILVI